MMKTFPLTLEEMRAWAAAQEPDAVVGHAGDAADCPCQRCIVELGKVPEDSELAVYFTAAVFRDPVSGPFRHHPLPAWMRYLVRAIDDWGGDITERPVTAATLLRLLDEEVRP